MKSGRDLHARGAEWKGGIRKSFPVLFTFSFPSFLSQQESCFNQQERTLVTHSSTACVSRFYFYHFLTSSVIYYWTDPGQHEIYRTIPKISSEGYLYLKVPFLRGLFLEGRIFGDPYIQRDLFVSKSARLIYYWLVGKYASQNPCVGLAYSWKEIYVGNCSNFLLKLALGTEIFLKLSHASILFLWTKEIQATKTAIYCDTFRLQSFGTRNSS